MNKNRKTENGERDARLGLKQNMGHGWHACVSVSVWVSWGRGWREVGQSGWVGGARGWWALDIIR
jgi:hypothetical protein